ncbi:MAG: fimbria/pilus outer membrane usher protein [Rhodomicrobium sp.]
MTLLAGHMRASAAAGGVTTVAKETVMRAQPLVTINLALKDGKLYLGEIPAQIKGETVLAVDQDSLLQLSQPCLNSYAANLVRSLPVSRGFVALDSLRDAGFAMDFSMEQLTLSFRPTVEQRPKGHISLSQAGEPAASEQLAPRAPLSGYLNLNGSARSASGAQTSSSQTLGTTAAIRLLNLVIENEATLSPGQSTRQGTRVVYDDPAQALRFSAGDVSPAITGLQGGKSLLGFSLQKSYSTLQPQKGIRPTGQRSFRLDRPSEVDIVVNGQVVQRLQLPPGDHDISDLPLRAGENNLTLEITDDTGKHTTLNFTVFFDHSLLSPGVSEWAVAGGVTSTAGLTGLSYAWSNPAATAYYQTGVTEDFTATMHLQADSQAVMGGVMGVTQSWFGLLSYEVAQSERVDGVPGAAASLTYSPEALFKQWDVPGIAQAAINYRSAYFSPILAAASSSGNTFSLNGFYSIAVADGYNLALSANGTLGSGGALSRGGGGISLTKTVQPNLTWALTASYDSSEAVSGEPAGPSWDVVARLSLKLGKRTELSVSDEGPQAKSVIGLSSEGQAEDGRYQVKGQLENDPGAPNGVFSETDLSGSYSGTRFDASFSHTQQLLAGGAVSNVSVISGAAAIAFAGNQIAVGRPVTDSFAIVTQHESLDGATLRVAPGDAGPRGVSDALGPALVPDLPSYSTTQLPVAAEGAPEGYDLGSGVFQVRPDYKSGYVLNVGSDYSVTAIGLAERDGRPISLVSGLAKETGVAAPRRVALFTNREGRFSANGLRAGQWRLELLSSPPACFRLAIPERTYGLFDAGHLKPGCAS